MKAVFFGFQGRLLDKEILLNRSKTISINPFFRVQVSTGQTVEFVLDGVPARLFALLNVALADAGIVCWETKYHYNWWRPITAIRAGDADGNPETAPDPTWKPLIPSPPFPEHTSGHSTFSGAGAAVLAEVTGSDEFAFVMRSDGLPGVVRRFTRFSDAAREAGQSRIYGGIHFYVATEGRLEAGRKVGESIAMRLLPPIR